MRTDAFRPRRVWWLLVLGIAVVAGRTPTVHGATCLSGRPGFPCLAAQAVPAGPSGDSSDAMMQRFRQALGLPAGRSWPMVAGVPMPVELPGAASLTAQEVYARTVDSVLFVVATRTEGSAVYTSRGSAVAVSPAAALTNCHVVMYGSGSEKDPGFRFTSVMPTITLTAHDGARGRAALLASHPDLDICLLRIEDVALRPIKGIVPYHLVAIGERVYSLGNPKGLTFSLADGLVAAKRDRQRLSQNVCADVIQTSAPISPGSSGGALLNAAGMLIGITQSVVEDGQNLNFAIAVDLLWRQYPDGGAVRIASPLYPSCP